MDMKYIILSLNDSTARRPVFWSADNAGYTYAPFAAGQYTAEQVEGNPLYYNDGINTIAIPLTDEALHKCGLKFTINIKELKGFIAVNKHKGTL